MSFYRKELQHSMRVAERNAGKVNVGVESHAFRWTRRSLTADQRSDLTAPDDALTRLAALDERKAQVVELRFFGGCNSDHELYREIESSGSP